MSGCNPRRTDAATFGTASRGTPTACADRPPRTLPTGAPDPTTAKSPETPAAQSAEGCAKDAKQENMKAVVEIDNLRNPGMSPPTLAVRCARVLPAILLTCAACFSVRTWAKGADWSTTLAQVEQAFNAGRGFDAVKLLPQLREQLDSAAPRVRVTVASRVIDFCNDAYLNDCATDWLQVIAKRYFDQAEEAREGQS